MKKPVLAGYDVFTFCAVNKAMCLPAFLSRLVAASRESLQCLQKCSQDCKTQFQNEQECFIECYSCDKCGKYDDNENCGDL